MSQCLVMVNKNEFAFGISIESIVLKIGSTYLVEINGLIRLNFLLD